jgi:hypothetical protein
MSSTKKKPTGSPRTEPAVTPAKFQAVLELIKQGYSAKRAREQVGITGGGFHRYMDGSLAAAEAYARARDARNDVMAEALQDLADEQPPTDSFGKVDSGWVAWQRNRVDTRKWLLSKMAPKKYGDASRVELDAGGNLINLLAKLAD